MTCPPMPIGLSDFKILREEGYYYIDKTMFIAEIIRAAARVLLIPRPRRFGKTLNMSMLRYFFENSREDNSGLFTGMQIEAEEALKQHREKYPLIFLTFKDLKDSVWETMLDGLKHIIRDEFNRHKDLLESDALSDPEKKYFRTISEGKGGVREYTDALRYLSAFLYRHYREPVVILIDEYDTPVHTAWAEGYYKETVNFLRSFLSGGLKDNPHLFKGVLTGILRIAKESVFSDLNNLDTYTILDKGFSTSFGFTDKEVKKILGDFKLIQSYNDVAHWYDGYLFGGGIIYNPWSVIQYAHRQPGIPLPYWNNTASTEIINRLATRSGRELRDEIGLLLEGTAIEKPVYESIVMRDLDVKDDLLWSFLLFSGYLKPVERIDYENWKLAIPNREVRLIYRSLIQNWFSEKIRSHQLDDMLKGLTTGNILLFERMLRKIVLEIMSFHDLAGEPEKVYHALVLGMVVWLSDAYEIRSNRESGLGRFDLMLKPEDPRKEGIIIEFKQVEDYLGEKPETALKNALKQIEDRRYAAELEAAGIENILKLAIVFQGKELWVKQG